MLIKTIFIIKTVFKYHLRAINKFYISIIALICKNKWYRPFPRYHLLVSLSEFMLEGCLLKKRDTRN